MVFKILLVVFSNSPRPHIAFKKIFWYDLSCLSNSFDNSADNTVYSAWIWYGVKRYNLSWLLKLPFCNRTFWIVAVNTSDNPRPTGSINRLHIVCHLGWQRWGGHNKLCGSCDEKAWCHSGSMDSQNPSPDVKVKNHLRLWASNLARNSLRAKGTLLSEPRFSMPCEMRIFPTRERENGLFSKKNPWKRPFSLSRVGKIASRRG